jgi:hypothetical protein
MRFICNESQTTPFAIEIPRRKNKILSLGILILKGIRKSSPYLRIGAWFIIEGSLNKR